MEGLAQVIGATSYSDTLALKIPVICNTISHLGYNSEFDAILDFRLEGKRAINQLNDSLSFFKLITPHHKRHIDFSASTSFLTEMPEDLQSNVISCPTSNPKNENPNSIRGLFCAYKRDDVSASEFERFWNSDEHEQQLMEYADILKAEGFYKTLLKPDSDFDQMNLKLGYREPFDGVVDFRWSSLDALKQVASSPNLYQHFARLRDARTSWINSPRSSLLITEPPALSRQTMKVIAPQAEAETELVDSF